MREINRHNKQGFCPLGFQKGLFFVFLRARGDTRTDARRSFAQEHPAADAPARLCEKRQYKVANNAHTQKHAVTHQPDLRADEDVRHPGSPPTGPPGDGTAGAARTEAARTSVSAARLCLVDAAPRADDGNASRH